MAQNLTEISDFDGLQLGIQYESPGPLQCEGSHMCTMYENRTVIHLRGWSEDVLIDDGRM